MVLAEISIKLIFLPNRKECSVPRLVGSNAFYGPKEFSLIMADPEN